MRVLIAGCGYVGTTLGLNLLAAGHTVAALRRSEASLTALGALGFEPIRADLTQAASLRDIRADWDWVVQCTAPAHPDVDTYETAYLQSTRTLLAWVDRVALRAFLFTSSTSVYGQEDGSWITESSPAEPSSATARALVRTEHEVLAASSSGLPTRILRVAGIYGPDRNRIAALRRGEGIPGDRRHYVNMIHRDDVASAMVRVLERGVSGGIYHASDGTPVLRGEFLEWLARQLGIEPPPPVPFRTTAGARMGGHKRLCIDRLKHELGWEPRYPSFREGYAALLHAA